MVSEAPSLLRLDRPGEAQTPCASTHPADALTSLSPPRGQLLNPIDSTGHGQSSCQGAPREEEAGPAVKSCSHMRRVLKEQPGRVGGWEMGWSGNASLKLALTY